MGFLKKVIDFVSRPTQSRTMGLVVMLILVATVSLTVYVAQQQQNLRQRAAERDATCSPPYIGYQSKDDLYTIECPACAPDQNPSGNLCLDCKAKQPSSYRDLCKKEGFVLITSRNDGKDYCYKNTNVGKACGPNNVGTCDDEAVCVILPNCGKLDCPSGQTCIGISGRSDTLCLGKGTGGTGSYCGTPDKLPNSEACSSGRCDATLHCISSPTPTPIPTTPPAPTSSPAPTVTQGSCPDGKTVNGRYHICAGSATLCTTGGGRIESGTCPLVERVCCSFPPQTPSSTPIPATASCPTNGDGRCGAGTPPAPNCTGLFYPTNIPISNCTTERPYCWSCPGPTSTPIPTSQCTVSDCGLCAVGSSCQQKAGVAEKSCSCQIITVASPPAPAGSVNVNLVMALNVQDAILSDDPLPVKLALYNLTTNTLVSGAPATQSFTKTPITTDPPRQYTTNIPLTNLAAGKYFIVARRDNMIAKSVFTVTSSSGNIEVPITKLVFGDINKDNDINALDYQLLRPCYKKTITANASCLASDFDKNEVIDQVDLNTLLRGWATWNKEGKEL